MYFPNKNPIELNVFDLLKNKWGRLCPKHGSRVIWIKPSVSVTLHLKKILRLN